MMVKNLGYQWTHMAGHVYYLGVPNWESRIWSHPHMIKQNLKTLHIEKTMVLGGVISKRHLGAWKVAIFGHSRIPKAPTVQNRPNRFPTGCCCSPDLKVRTNYLRTCTHRFPSCPNLS